MTEFFISDTHFKHKNIITFENRPYSDCDEMEEGMVKNWNSIVSEEDTVYMLGDFCFGGYSHWNRILGKLKGNIIMIKGNHDKSKILNRALEDGLLKEVHMVGHLLRVGKYSLNLTHYPLDIGNRPYIFNLSGHIHSEPSRMINQLNLGVDSEFVKSFGKPFGTPISMDEILEVLDNINPILEELHSKGEGLHGEE